MTRCSDAYAGERSQTMKVTLKHVLAAIILMLSLAAPVVAGPLEDAAAAYGRGDYATTLRLIRPLADQGDASAQYKRPGRTAGLRRGGEMVSPRCGPRLRRRPEQSRAPVRQSPGRASTTPRR
jgi:hypothetical protein